MAESRVVGGSGVNYTSASIYEAARDIPKGFIKKIEPITDFNLNVNLSSGDQIDGSISHLHLLIKQLREQDFNGHYTDNDGKKVLVKYHDEKTNSDKTYNLNPIQKYEEKVQALRYIRGMLLIARHTNNNSTLVAALNPILESFKLNENADTLLLAEQFALCLAKNLNISPDSARKQVTMARDIGILLEEHPAVCTVSEENDKVTVEKSTPYKISADYYRDSFQHLKQQPWFQNARKLAGFSAQGNNTWMEEVFFENFEELKKLGVTAPPSARWLPIPANIQTVDIDVAQRINKETTATFSHTSFIRTGVVVPYDIRKVNDASNIRKNIAKKTLYELLTSEIEKRIIEYKSVYKGLINENNFRFYLNYQTLLSPLLAEKRLPHIDNNAKFVEVAKEVIQEIANDKDLKSKYKEQGVELCVTHTNSAVNRVAFISNEFSEDDATRVAKIDEFARCKEEIYKRLPPNFRPDKLSKIPNLQDVLKNLGMDHPNLADELVRRERACECLQNILDKKAPYNKLRRYQRNIMLAAIEQLAMGSQALPFAGCKSARDRTKFYAAALKTMLENPASMEDWKLLKNGIVKSLHQGHGFRSMIFHSAIVKVQLVHPSFMRRLNEQTRQGIRTLFMFSKKLPPYNKSKKMPASMPTDVSSTVLTEQPEKNAFSDSMTISKDQAARLLATIDKKDQAETLRANKSQWVEALRTFTTDISGMKTIEEIDQLLLLTRNKQLNSESYVESLDGLNVRIYPHKNSNLDASVSDFFASGIDSARGVLVILKNSGIADNIIENGAAKVNNALQIFHARISDINKSKDISEETKLAQLKLAKQEYLKLQGAFADILVSANCYKEKALATKGMLEARDFLWIKARDNEAVCTINDTTGQRRCLSLSIRMTFSSNDMLDYETQPWFREFSSKHPWAREFYKNNPEILSLSPTPMQRSTPNIANAWKVATILSEGSDPVQIISGIRAGISSPFQISDKDERQRLTNRNHSQIVTDKNLLQIANTHINTWSGLLPNGKIIIPIVHQTLIDPGAIRYLANRSGANPSDMIKRKKKANKILQNNLDKTNFYYDNKTNAIVMNPNPPLAHHVKIEFSVKEINNGINIHEKMTKKTPRDTKDAHELILLTRDKLQLFRNTIPTADPNKIAQMTRVIKFLTKCKPATPTAMTHQEIQDMRSLCEDLLKDDTTTPYSHLDKTTRANLALLVQAATNLASFLSNKTGTSVIGFVRDSAVVLHPKFKQADSNDSTYKSCYEHIMAELLGVRWGGCKSSLDRGNEIVALTTAMYRKFHVEGTISNYYDTPDEKNRFRSMYVNTQDKHNMCRASTATQGSSDLETQGKAFDCETDYEKRASTILERTCRHPKHTDYTYAQFIAPPSDKHENKRPQGFAHAGSSLTLFGSSRRVPKHQEAQHALTPGSPPPKIKT